MPRTISHLSTPVARAQGPPRPTNAVLKALRLLKPDSTNQSALKKTIMSNELRKLLQPTGEEQTAARAAVDRVAELLRQVTHAGWALGYTRA